MRSPAGAPGSRLPAPRGAPCRTARARSAQLRVRSALTPCGTGVTAGSASSRFRSPSQNIWLNLEITFLIARKRNMTNRLTTRLASENHFPWTMERLVFSLVAGTEFFMIHLLGCIPSRFFPTSSGCQLLSLSFLKSPDTQYHRIPCTYTAAGPTAFISGQYKPQRLHSPHKTALVSVSLIHSDRKVLLCVFLLFVFPSSRSVTVFSRLQVPSHPKQFRIAVFLQEPI